MKTPAANARAVGHVRPGGHTVNRGAGAVHLEDGTVDVECLARHGDI